MKQGFLVCIVSFILFTSCGNGNSSEKTSTDSSTVTTTQVVKNDSQTTAKDTSSRVDTLSSQSKVESYPDIKPTVTIKTLWANEVTDLTHAGPVKVNQEDEVYFLLAGKKSDGTIISERLPYRLTWSLQKSGGPAKQSLEAKYGPFGAWSGTLKNGESVELNFIFMDEDNSKPGEAITAASQAANKTNSDDDIIGFISSIGEVIGGIIANDKDDFLGAFAVRITNDKGNIRTEWQTKDNCLDKGTDQNGKRFDLNGSNAYYMTTVDVR